MFIFFERIEITDLKSIGIKMNKEHHIRRQNRFMPLMIDTLLLRKNADITREVNEDKDSMYKEFPGINHRMYKHGVGSNIRYLLRQGIRGWKAGAQHDLDDIRHSLGTPGKSKIQTMIALRRIRFRAHAEFYIRLVAIVNA